MPADKASSIDLEQTAVAAVRAALLVGATVLTAVAYTCLGADDFPAAPPSVSVAEAAGLHRIDAAELNQAYAGRRVLRAATGESIRLDLRPDGTLDYADDKGVTDTGSWSATARNGGTLCRRYSKQMGGRSCVIYFAAPDGVNWFGYDANSGQWRDTTHAWGSE
jgi:catechol 2,3-dioxygenase-like lactoylglutathione lyase family enzyme